ncbi:MAG TPA: twin-arginine translocase TatA/TatE family subunit [Rhizomicrobium sp.]|jgi:sec-independent protein translocase protein TatA|nr:twin-arginine translocase TatA/TatE family subunit [Rhizomicrobium sp.]
MGTLSIWHILILAVVALLLFGGRGKISDLMGDVAKGIRSFRKGLNEPDDERAISDRRENGAGKDTPPPGH